MSNSLCLNWTTFLPSSAKSLQSCPTLCDPIDGSPPGSPIPGILQTRTLEWVAISFSNAWKWKVKVKSLSRVRLPATSWTAAHQVPPPMGFSRQEYWSGVPLPSPIWKLTYHLIYVNFKGRKMTDLRVSQAPSAFWFTSLPQPFSVILSKSLSSPECR